jgi:hypothetical protein
MSERKRKQGWPTGGSNGGRKGRQRRPEGLLRPVALEFKGGTGEVAKGVEDADVGAGTFGEFGLKSRGIKFGEEGVNADHGDTKAGLVEEVGVRLLNDGGGKIEASAHFFEPGLFTEPILESAGMPAGEVGLIEVMALLAKGCDDSVVGSAIAEEEIEALAQFSGQAGDFAMAPNAVGFEVGWRGFRG